jgi:hypothetical protein
MAKLKTYNEPKTIPERSEFFTFCASLSTTTSKSWDVNQLSTLLNSQFSKHAEVNSPIDTLWKTARANLNQLTPPARSGRFLGKVLEHPIVATIIGTIIATLLISYF